MTGKGAAAIPIRAHQNSDRSHPKPDIRQKLERLEHMDLKALRLEWNTLWHELPPMALKRATLLQAIAYRLQVEIFGDVPKPLQRELAFIARKQRSTPPRGEVNQDQVRRPAPRLAVLKPGTRLIKVWHEQTYEVEVLESGFQWNGKAYRSLSQIARDITGTRWNGLAFFGLRKSRSVLQQKESRKEATKADERRKDG